MQLTALIIASVAAFISPFMGSAINIALPGIGESLSMDVVSLGWVATIYLLSSAVILVPAGKLADIYGRKKLFKLGIIAYTFASGLCAFSPSGNILLLSRVVQGLGAGVIYCTGVAILISVYPPDKRGRALGINVASVYVGLTSGPFIGGLMVHHLGWRSIFILNSILGLFIIILIHMKLKGEWKESKESKFDIKGSLIYSAAILSLMWGMSSLPEIYGFVLIASGAAGLVFFYLFESRARYPVVNFRVFSQNRLFTLSNLAAFIHYSSTFAVFFFLSMYLQYVSGLDPQSAGLVLVAQPVIMAVLSPFAGRLSERFEPRFLATTGMAITGFALLLLIMLGAGSPISWVIMSQVILGIGFAIFSSPNMNAIMGSVKKKYYGFASGMAATMRLVGQTFSMGISMMMISIFIGAADVSIENQGLFLSSMKISFMIFFGLCIIGIFASAARGKKATE